MSFVVGVLNIPEHTGTYRGTEIGQWLDYSTSIQRVVRSSPRNVNGVKRKIIRPNSDHKQTSRQL